MENETEKKRPSILELLDQWYANQIPGGKGDAAKPSDFDEKEVLMGLYIELEHTDDPWKALEIVIDHLTEDRAYYSKLKKIHKESVDRFGIPLVG